MPISILNIIKSIENNIHNMNRQNLASIRDSIDMFGATVCENNANILRRKFWAQAKMLELI